MLSVGAYLRIQYLFSFVLSADEVHYSKNAHLLMMMKRRPLCWLWQYMNHLANLHNRHLQQEVLKFSQTSLPVCLFQWGKLQCKYNSGQREEQCSLTGREDEWITCCLDPEAHVTDAFLQEKTQLNESLRSASLQPQFPYLQKNVMLPVSHTHSKTE